MPIAAVFITAATLRSITNIRLVEVAVMRSITCSSYAILAICARGFSPMRSFDTATGIFYPSTATFLLLLFPKIASLGKPGGPGRLAPCGAFTGNASPLHAGAVASATFYLWWRC